MKKSILFAVAIMFLALQVDAQQPQPPQFQQERNDDMQGEPDCRNVSILKRQYIQDSLKLDGKEYQSFWKLFDTYEQKEQAIHEKFQIFNKEQNFPMKQGRVLYKELTDDQKVLFLEQKMIMKAELTLIEQRFFQELKTNLSPETVVRYYQLEKSFRKEMIHRSRIEKKDDLYLPTKKRR